MISRRCELEDRVRGSRSRTLLLVGVLCVVFFSERGFAESPAPPDVADSAQQGLRWLPSDELFDPLVADVRWPRFFAEHQWRLGTDEFSRVGSVGFGESFTFVRAPKRDWGQWEVGFQAMVDAIFDMSSRSFDLANEDYFVALTASVAVRGVTTQLRLYHLSSHLGDEYLMENRVSRDDISYEVIDLLASSDPTDFLRVYGGGGVLVNARPDLDPLMFQLGFELTSTKSFAGGLLTPFAGTDVQLKQENDWVPEVAVLVGLRLADPAQAPARDLRRLELYARFYHGRSPEGQFYRDTLSSLALGIRLGF